MLRLLLPREQWCGNAAGTTSNIKLMAECIARKPLADKEVFNVGANVIGCYFAGAGLAGSAGLPGFVQYVASNEVEHDIRDKCVEAYKFIVDHFTEGSEVWMLGFSRGAFTVRSVAGMVNNFGILGRERPGDGLEPLCTEIYRMYMSKDNKFHPNAPFPAEFQAEHCVDLHGRPPIKFMGLLDTVGLLGVPKVDAGIDCLFYDLNVSSEVENVYQALAAHDRLFGFDPCFVRRKPGTVSGITQEVWFPGAHLDMGRQRFVPFRLCGGLLERVAHNICSLSNVLLINTEPTIECSVEPLMWLLKCMRHTDSSLLDDAGLSATVKRCLQVPWRDGIPFLPQALGKDAFDHMSMGVLGKISPLFASFALRDRDIPAYSDAKFIGGESGADNELAFISPGSGFISRAYNIFRALRPEGIKWVDGQAELVAGKGAVALAAHAQEAPVSIEAPAEANAGHAAPLNPSDSAQEAATSNLQPVAAYAAKPAARAVVYRPRIPLYDSAKRAEALQVRLAAACAAKPAAMSPMTW